MSDEKLFFKILPEVLLEIHAIPFVLEEEGSHIKRLKLQVQYAGEITNR